MNNNTQHLKKWEGKYGGVPQFSKFTTEDIQPAIEESIIESQKLISEIASNSADPTFQNTIEPFEDLVHGDLSRACSVYGIFKSNLCHETVQKVEEAIESKLTDFWDKVYQDDGLFQRIKKIHLNNTELNEEQKRLVEVFYKKFVSSGAQVSKEEKPQLSEINQKLCALYTQFRHNILSDESSIYTVLTGADLDGLSEDIIEGAKASAIELKLAEGSYAILNTRSSVEPFLTSSKRRDLRQTVFEKFIQRGAGGGDFKDNTSIISEILQFRAKRCLILGFPTHAHWKVDDTMAKTPENALKLMENVWTHALKRLREEVVDMQRLADSEGNGVIIEPWDYRFYAEKVRLSNYDLDMDIVKPYFQLEKLREGMFYAVNKLFGISFRQVHDLPVFHSDVRIWEVLRDDVVIGLWYFDPYARKWKNSGAWMCDLRAQQKYHSVIPIITNNANFIKGDPNSPLLISFDDGVTLFHEFGHACHGLLSNVTYASLSGTNVYVDYVEFPSQLMEHWLTVDEVLQKFAVNQEGLSLPSELIQKILKTQKFNKGFETVEFLSSALIDMKLHLAAKPTETIDPLEFEAKNLKELGMPKEIVMRHRTTQFSHIFDGEGYSACYWSYLWADTIVADAWEAFTVDGKGPFDKDVADRLLKHVFSVGNTIDPAKGYVLFRGHEYGVDALLRKRGFID
jgi:peptidyl-dipeptidase Dcp